MKINELTDERDALRERWRGVRGRRLDLKEQLISKGLIPGEVRKNREYRHLKKEQKRLSRMISHLERDIQRRARSGESQ